MSLWVDKHRPTALHKLDFHKEQALHLKKLVMNLVLPTIQYWIYSKIINAVKRQRNLGLYWIVHCSDDMQGSQKVFKSMENFWK